MPVYPDNSMMHPKSSPKDEFLLQLESGKNRQNDLIVLSKRKLGGALLACPTLSLREFCVSSGDTLPCGKHQAKGKQDTLRYSGYQATYISFYDYQRFLFH